MTAGGVRLVIDGPVPRKNWKHRVFVRKHVTGKQRAIGRTSTPEYEDFVDRVIAAWGRCSHVGFGDAPEVHVRIWAYWPTLRRADVDAPVECVLDALTRAEVWEDDSQVRSVAAVKLYRKGQPGVVVKIWREQ